MLYTTLRIQMAKAETYRGFCSLYKLAKTKARKEDIVQRLGLLLYSPVFWHHQLSCAA